MRFFASLRMTSTGFGHTHLIAVGVDAQLNQVMGPQRVPLSRLADWARKTLTAGDALVLEMTTNAFQLYDDLPPTPIPSPWCTRRTSS
jgi:hypothetical protein